MQREHDDHGTGTVVVKATEKGTGCYLLGDVSDAGVGSLSGGNVVERQAQSRNDLRYENIKESGSEDVCETRPAWDGFVE